VPDLDILFTAAEVAPYSKAGGLADVAGSLPEALLNYVSSMQVITPLYGQIDCSANHIEQTTISGEILLGATIQPYILWKHTSPDSRLITWFIDNQQFFRRTGIYTTAEGTGFADNIQRYLFFQRVIMDLILKGHFSVDLLHCNDHHTALLPALIKAKGLQIKTVFTIHNFLYQGHFDANDLPLLPDHTDSLLTLTPQHNYSALLEGIDHADVVTTVSPGYAAELLAGEHCDSYSLIHIQQAEKKFFGIVNGIDTIYWDPEHDSQIPAHYSLNDPTAKLQNKAALLAQSGLDTDLSAPLIGSISRLVENKGFPLLLELLDSFVEQGVKFTFLGSGDPVIAQQLAAAVKRHPGRIAFENQFNEPLAHLIEAGSDLFLMPSRFEPCGLNQLYSLRYGTIPIVSRTGGLGDTVEPWSPGQGTGFVFTPYALTAFRESIQLALEVYHSPDEWQALIIRAMSRDYSWQRSARQYYHLYQT